LLVSAS